MKSVILNVFIMVSSLICNIGLSGELSDSKILTGGLIVPWVPDEATVEADMPGEIVFDDGEKIFYGYNGTSWVNLGSSTSAIGTLNSQTKSSNGAVVSGSSLYLQTADDTKPGLVNTFKGDSQDLESGTYSPTVTASTNLSSASASADFKFHRVGDMVTVSGAVSVSQDAATTGSIFYVSLPISSNLTGTYDLTGTGTVNDATSVRPSTFIHADTTNDRAQINWTSQSANNNRDVHIIFHYEIK